MTTPFVCVLVALLLVYAPKIPLSIAMANEGKYDNRLPRAQQDRLTGWGARARAAHMNGFESFPPFAAGVLIAHLAGADPAKATVLALVHVAARVAYPILYIADIPTARSTVWGGGFLATLGLYVLPMLG